VLTIVAWQAPHKQCDDTVSLRRFAVELSGQPNGLDHLSFLWFACKYAFEVTFVDDIECPTCGEDCEAES
jgi:hypothetical protein